MCLTPLVSVSQWLPLHHLHPCFYLPATCSPSYLAPCHFPSTLCLPFHHCPWLIWAEGESQSCSCSTSALHCRDQLCGEPRTARDNIRGMQVPPGSRDWKEEPACCCCCPWLSWSPCRAAPYSSQLQWADSQLMRSQGSNSPWAVPEPCCKEKLWLYVGSSFPA